MGAVEVIAHRGASAYRTENTLAAFELALEQGADVLELDVRASADGEVVTVHDPTMLRTAGDPRRVDELTRAALGAIEPAAARPASLEEVLARFGAGTRYLVDLKDPAPTWEGRVAEAIDRHGLRERAIVQSFDFESLRRLRTGAPWLELGALDPPMLGPQRPLDLVAAIATGIGVPHAALDAAFVAAAHARGLAVRAWTVDAPADIERMAGLGVDGVITNAPDVAATVLGAPTAGRAAA
jgi:glycerophosphoryl diester phosphodiesterase